MHPQDCNITDAMRGERSYLFRVAEQPADALRKRRKIQRERRPFGGLNVIMTGDFWQLPPVKQTSVFCSPFGGSHSSQAQRMLSMFWQREADSINSVVELTQDLQQHTKPYPCGVPLLGLTLLRAVVLAKRGRCGIDHPVRNMLAW